MPQIKNSGQRDSEKKRIAVFFGGRSPEHDVSVVTGLQVLQAVDQARYDAFPVYITPEGEWRIGEILRRRENYLLDKSGLQDTTPVTLDLRPHAGDQRRGVFLSTKRSLFGPKAIEYFDVAIPAFHGLFGEDGNMQGLFEVAGIPYTGMRSKASAVLMDKALTKNILAVLDIPHLPHALLKRPDQGYMIPASVLEDHIRGIGFPCIVKPSHLGSSIGVARADNTEELGACLPGIFEFDDEAIVEPFVSSMAEYNVAVMRAGGRSVTSAVEKPKSTEELLDFKQKYLSGGDDKTGTKTPGETSEGMLSLTRELNPPLNEKTEKNIRRWAVRLFDALGGTGAPRIDYLSDSKTGEIWLNEVNPCPGSFGYFLWEAAEKPLLFTEFLTHLIEEALEERHKKDLPADPVPVDARLLKRP